MANGNSNVFSGYVFICCQYSADIYHKVKQVKGVIKILPNAIHPVPLHPHEGDFIKICSRGVIGLHDIVREDGNVVITCGELEGFGGRVVMLRPRQRRAVLEITLCGHKRLISIGLNNFTKSEAQTG